MIVTYSITAGLSCSGYGWTEWKRGWVHKVSGLYNQNPDHLNIMQINRILKSSSKNHWMSGRWEPRRLYLVRAFKAMQGDLAMFVCDLLSMMTDVVWKPPWSPGCMFQLRPLGKELYAGAIDACGGKVLANILPLVRKQLSMFVYVPEQTTVMGCSYS